MHKDIKILQAAVLPEKTNRELREHFTVLTLPLEQDAIDQFLTDHGSDIRGIAVRKTHIDAAMMQRLPALEVISSYSAGLEGVDVEAARARGIAVHNTSKVLAEDVADLGLGLIINVARGLHHGHNFVRDGRWPHEAFPLGRSLRALSVGIIGLGHIGLALARRLETMGVSLAYYGPNEKPVPYPFFPDLHALATWADMLVVTCPGGDATRHLVNDRILAALGADGFLVNISRGTVVDEQALISALDRHALAGAALDVFENEPNVAPELLNNDRVVLSPHMGSGSKETRQLMGDSVVGALLAHFREG
jgi:lactate dehydrogenase-like 2-hydroxyacid dehydrogenase